jgi:hypothetical protein
MIHTLHGIKENKSPVPVEIEVKIRVKVFVQFCLNSSKYSFHQSFSDTHTSFTTRGKRESIPTQPETFSPFTWLLIYGIDNY